MTEVKTDPRRDEAEELRTEAARLRERIGQLEPRHARALDDADEADSKIAEIGRRREALVMDLYGGDEAAASEDSGLRDEAAELARRSEVAKGAAARFDEELADLRRRHEEAARGPSTRPTRPATASWGANATSWIGSFRGTWTRSWRV